MQTWNAPGCVPRCLVARVTCHRSSGNARGVATYAHAAELRSCHLTRTPFTGHCHVGQLFRDHRTKTAMPPTDTIIQGIRREARPSPLLDAVSATPVVLIRMGLNARIVLLASMLVCGMRLAADARRPAVVHARQPSLDSPLARSARDSTARRAL